jgi:hypothetical protein
MHRCFPILFALACVTPGTATDDGPDWIPADGMSDKAPPEPVLTLDAGSLLPGYTTVFTVTEAVPGLPVHLAASLGGLGEGPCLGDACVGLTLPVVVVGTTTADAGGTAVLPLLLPERFGPGTELAFQAVQRDGETTWLSTAGVWTVEDPEVDPEADEDGDGFVAAEDCDDSNPSVHPGALELCDGLDTDCDPATDEAGRVIVDSAGEFATIAEALGAASDHGLVEVCDGTFDVRNLMITRPVTLVGAGIGKTILDGGGEHRLVDVDGTGDVTVRGFSMVGGDTTEVSHGEGGGSVRFDCSRCGGLLLEDVAISGSAATHGGGVMVQGGSVTLRRVSVEGGVAEEHGGALYVDTVWADRLVRVEDSTLSSNSAVQGGAIYLEGSTVEVVDSVVENNSATERGGGAKLFGDMWGTAVLVSSGSDWGFGIGSDNSPEDVSAGTVSVAHYGFDESFTCTMDGDGESCG